MLTSLSFRSRNFSSMSKREQNQQQQSNSSKILRTSSQFKKPMPTKLPESKSTFYPPPPASKQAYLYKSALVFDNRQTNKQLLHQFNSTLRRQIASLTKIMTCYIALEFIEDNQLIPEDVQCQVSKQAAQLKGTSAGLEEGNVISLWDLLHGLMLPSGNDAALCIAENIGRMMKQKKSQQFVQSLSKRYQCVSPRIKQRRNYKINQSQNQLDVLKIFIKQMNSKCKHLQMLDTHYTNAHGLCDHQNFSTSKDQLILIQQCLKNNLFRRIVSTKLYFGTVKQKGQIWTNEIIWQNTNRLLHRGYQGIKTGSTTSAGFCLASWYCTAEVDLIVIILGCNSKEERDYHTLRLTKNNINKQLHK